MAVNVLTESERNAMDLMGSNLSHEDLQVIDGLCKLGSKRHQPPSDPHSDQSSPPSSSSISPTHESELLSEAQHEHISSSSSSSSSSAPPHKLQKLSQGENPNADAFSSLDHFGRDPSEVYVRQRGSSFDLRDALNPSESAGSPYNSQNSSFSIENITSSSFSPFPSSPPPFSPFSYDSPSSSSASSRPGDTTDLKPSVGKGVSSLPYSFAHSQTTSTNKRSMRQIAIAPRHMTGGEMMEGGAGGSSSSVVVGGAGGSLGPLRSNPRLSSSAGLRLPALQFDRKKERGPGDRTYEEYAAESFLASMIDDHPKNSHLLLHHLHKSPTSSSSSSSSSSSAASSFSSLSHSSSSLPLPHSAPLFQQFHFNAPSGPGTGASSSGGVAIGSEKGGAEGGEKTKPPKASQASSIPYKTDEYISFNKVTQHLIDSDVEALGYVLVYVRTGGLPGSGSSNVGVGGKQPKYWCGVPRHGQEERWFKWANVVSLFPAGMEVTCEIDSVSGVSDWLQACGEHEIKRQRLVSKSIPPSSFEAKSSPSDLGGVPVREFYQVERTVKFTGKPGHSKAEGKRKMKTLAFSLVLNISSQTQSLSHLNSLLSFPRPPQFPPISIVSPESLLESDIRLRSLSHPSPSLSSSASSSVSLRNNHNLSTSTAEVPLPVEIPPMESLRNPVIFGTSDLEHLPEKRGPSPVTPFPLSHSHSHSHSHSVSSLSSSAPALPLTPSKQKQSPGRHFPSRISAKVPSSPGQPEGPLPFALPSHMQSETNLVKKLKDISGSSPSSPSASPSRDQFSHMLSPLIYPKPQSQAMTCEKFEFPPTQDTKMTILECHARYTAPGSGTRTSPEKSFLRSVPQAIRIYKDPVTNHLRWQTVSFKDLGLMKSRPSALSSSGGHSFSPFLEPDSSSPRPSPSKPSS